MPKLTIHTLEDLKQWVGKEVAVSDWLQVDQDRIDRFADATGDHQWIHVDPARAASESPSAPPSPTATCRSRCSRT